MHQGFLDSRTSSHFDIEIKMAIQNNHQKILKFQNIIPFENIIVFIHRTDADNPTNFRLLKIKHYLSNRSLICTIPNSDVIFPAKNTMVSPADNQVTVAYLYKSSNLVFPFPWRKLPLHFPQFLLAVIIHLVERSQLISSKFQHVFQKVCPHRICKALNEYTWINLDLHKEEFR